MKPINIEPISYTNIINILPEQAISNAAQNGEYIGIAKLSKHEINTLNSSKMINSSIKYFFEIGIHLDVPTTDEVNFTKFKRLRFIRPYKYNPNSNLFIDKWYNCVFPFCKSSWLSFEFITFGGFNFPMSAVWNPTTNLYEINPGGHRLKTFYLFGPAEGTEFLTFNTGGKLINWIRNN